MGYILEHNYMNSTTGQKTICTQAYLLLSRLLYLQLFVFIESRKIELAGGYQFTVTEVPNAFVFSSP